MASRLIRWSLLEPLTDRSFLGQLELLDALNIANISLSMQSERIHLWGFIKTFQLNP